MIESTSGGGANGWQPDLFAVLDDPDPGATSAPDRLELDEWCWIDHASTWCRDPAGAFDALMAHQRWCRPSRVMFDAVVMQPRLSSWQFIDDPDLHPAIAAMARRLVERYGVDFRSVGVNLYRDGTDSVAWHGDRIGRRHPTTTVAIVALGERRPFMVRRRGAVHRSDGPPVRATCW